MIVARRLSAVLVLTLALSACATVRSDPDPIAPREYAAVLEQATVEARAGRYGITDRLLLDFAAKYPAAPEAVETLYWRALFKADPANQVALVREAIPLLDAYLGAPATATPHRMEAAALKRLVALVESRAATLSTTAPAPAPPATKPDEHAKEEELTRLKDELQKANAELQRIKRRLSQPRP